LPIHHLASSPGGLLSLAFADTPITFGRVPGMRLGRVGSDSELFEQNDRRKMTSTSTAMMIAAPKARSTSKAITSEVLHLSSNNLARRNARKA
jgi:hypothetical protein